MTEHEISTIKDISSIVFTGNMGGEKKYRFKYFEDGTAVLNFSVAINRSYKRKDGKKVARVIWIDCSMTGARAEAMKELLTKAKTVAVSGTLEEITSDESKGNTYINTRVSVLDIRVTAWKDGEGRDDDPEDEDTKW